MKECRRIAGLLGPYIYGDLELDEMHRVRVHAEGCKRCREEISARRDVVALIPNDVPKLSDDERLRISWAVKGAVRERNASSRARAFAWTALKGLAVSAVVVGVFAAGMVYELNGRPPKVVVKLVPAAVPAPAVLPNTTTAEDASSAAAAPRNLLASDPYRRPYGVETSRSGRGVNRTTNQDEQTDENTTDQPSEESAQSPLGSIIENQAAPQAQENNGLDPIWPALPTEGQGEQPKP